MKGLLFLLLLTGCVTTSAPAPKKGEVAVTLLFPKEDFDAGDMRVYDVDPKKNLKLWVTATVKKESDLPVGPEFKDNIVNMRPGGLKRMVLVMENPTAKTQYFFAAPHLVQPEKMAMGFEFRCLCMNQAYKIPPKSFWYRIIEVKLDKEYKTAAVEIRHTIIGVDAKRAATLITPGAVVDPPKGAGSPGAVSAAKGG